MSTHSYIGIENSNGTVDYVYCHFDGYLDGVGKDLVNMSREDVRTLVDAGDMRCIGEPFSDGHNRQPKSAANIDVYRAKINELHAFGYLINRRGVWKYVAATDCAFHSLKPVLKKLSK